MKFVEVILSFPSRYKGNTLGTLRSAEIGGC
jgi:hypothetical protein